jgi:methenyltetrahydrofolate cyclohydrolase
MLVTKTVTELLDAFASPAPTPGGGSAAALAGAVAASLLAMVAALPRTKHGTPDDRVALDHVLSAAAALKATLTGLVDRDAASYDEVVAAYRLPRGTDDEKAARTAAIQKAMKSATLVPLETARATAALVPLARTVALHGNPKAGSDVAVAIGLAMTAHAGGKINVEANLGSMNDQAFVDQARADLKRMMHDTVPHLAPAYEALGWKGHEPP